jgi:urea carboxylase-associated protein 2
MSDDVTTSPGSGPGSGRGPGTATVLGARDHARAQADSAAAGAVTTQPTIPAQSATDLPDGVAAADVVWDETLALGGYAARVVRRGVHLRIADLTGDTNVNLVLHHAARPIERLNLADTVKLQWNAYPGAGSLLLSDMGRVLATVLPDSTGAIDLFCGPLTPVLAAARYGGTGNSSPTPSGRDRLLLGLAKHGLTRRDLPPAANLFTTVRVDPDGTVRRLDDAESEAPTHLTLRAELDLLVAVAVTPHPLDDRAAYSGGPVRLTAWRGLPAGPDDPARSATPEAQRAFENTDDVLPTLPATPATPAAPATDGEA